MSSKLLNKTLFFPLLVKCLNTIPLAGSHSSSYLSSSVSIALAYICKNDEFLFKLFYFLFFRISFNFLLFYKNASVSNGLLIYSFIFVFILFKDFPKKNECYKFSILLD